MMFYYRYRPFSELNLKELLYGELYFTSTSECNDPFDSKSFYEFPNDRDNWKKLIQTSLQRLNTKVSIHLLEKILDTIVLQCPLTYDDVLSNNLFEKVLAKDRDESYILYRLLNHIHGTFKIHSPEFRYFVSFSKSNNEPLMWSHYTDKHTGYCLVFKSIEGCLKQNPNHISKTIYGKDADDKEIPFNSDIPENFKFIDIDYKTEVEPLNGFDCLPDFTVNLGKEDLKSTDVHYLQKHKNWEYENESRILLPPPFSQLNGGQVKYSKTDRLFRYEPTQLVGIIFGARMNSVNKNRIIEIIDEINRVNSYPVKYKRVWFDFVVFDAALSTNQRTINITPSLIITHSKIKSNHPEFNWRFERWKDGWGREVIDNHGEEIQIV